MMFRKIGFHLFVLALLSCNVLAGTKSSSKPGLALQATAGRFVPDRIVIKLRSSIESKPGRGASASLALDAFARRFGARPAERIFPHHASPARLLNSVENQVDLTQYFTLRFPAPVDVVRAARELSSHAEVEYAEPMNIYATDGAAAFAPNDSLYAQQWALAKVKADSAWNVSTGDSSVVIAILDTGVEWPHVDLTSKIWLNPGESGGGKESNAIDDDGNGYIDDYHGWDFIGADAATPIGDNDPRPNSPFSTHYHGTHVAGIAGAATNNSKGMASLGFNCKLMPLKVSDDMESDPGIYNWTSALVYAADMGAKIVNCSFGGSSYSQFEQDMVNYANGKGVLIVAAAGNKNSSLARYPASYRHVLSVAATTPTDGKASYSSFGTTVDVSAPGGDDPFTTSRFIVSTWPPNAYHYLIGTSMSSPLVAGLAGLVCSVFPSYTPDQIAEQIRVTCDNINTQNPSYINALGKGRINAYRALTGSSPAVRMITYVATDSAVGNGNGLLEPSEDFLVIGTFQNLLQPISSAATVTLTSSDAHVQVINGSFPIGALGTFATTTNASAPFRINTKSTVPVLYTANFTLTITDGSYSDVQLFSVLLNPLYATHNVNNVAFSIANFGSLGYHDYVLNPPYGVEYGAGFQFPRGSINALYHASPMVGTDAAHVADNVYGNTVNPSAVDFKKAVDGAFDFTTHAGAAQSFRCAFTDSGITSGANRLGLHIALRSYAYTTAADSDYIILRYDVRNTSAGTISNAFVGMFADWDVNDYSKNLLNYDSSRRLGYQWDSAGSNYYGVCLVNPTNAASYRAVNNPVYVYSGFQESNKYAFLSGGFTLTAGLTPDDWAMMLSAGPYTIAAGDSVTVGFAFLGGTNLADLQLNADAARARWATVVDVKDERMPGIPGRFALHQNFPNPFNPTTRFSYDLAAAGSVSLKVYDLLGREVATIVQADQPAGRFSVNFDASMLASGLYFYRLTATNATGGTQQQFSDIRKFMLVK